MKTGMKAAPAPAHIPMERVVSSNVKAIGHDPATKTLRIEFLHGGTYDYEGVPATVHQALMASDSKGSHFHKNIRGQYVQRKH